MTEPEKRDVGAPPPAKRKRHLISPLTGRILAINVVVLAIPVLGLIYLGPYRDSLIDAELQALRSHGEIIAGALGEAAVEITPSGGQLIGVGTARHIVWRLSAPTRIRSRLFLPSGRLVADSRFLMGTRRVVQIEELPAPRESNWVVDPLLDFIERLTNWVPRSEVPDPYIEGAEQSAQDYVEVVRALEGDILGIVRSVDEGQLILSVAVPVQRYRQIVGAMMVSKDSAAIEESLRDVRLTIVQLFAGALVVTVLLSFYLSGTIARPVLRLAAAAERVRRGIGRGTQQIPDFTKRRDEIGDLSAALRDMTDALHTRLDAIERFAADVSHEIKNPLTSLRSAVETVARIDDPAQQQQLMAIIKEDVQRLDRLITDISDASRLDAELSRAETEAVDIGGMLRTLTQMHETAGTGGPAPKVTIEIAGDGDLQVTGMADRLVQVFRNLMANAASFSPPGGEIALHASRQDDVVQVTVEDDGPGIPEGKLEAVFDRFYSERPAGEKFGTHSGLGLAISKQIIEAHGGTIYAENRHDSAGDVKGARFVVRLPTT